MDWCGMGKFMTNKDISELQTIDKNMWENTPDEIKKEAWYSCTSELLCSDGVKIKIENSTISAIKFSPKNAII